MNFQSAQRLADRIAVRAKSLQSCKEAVKFYKWIWAETGGHRLFVRELARRDLFFLMVFLLRRPDVAKQWLYERCREVEAEPNGHLDLWAREHYKSTIITFGLTIQDILASHGDDPLPVWGGREPTFGIFSHTRPISKKFVEQIKSEFENNTQLIVLFPDILWEKPSRDAVKWSIETGITVKRKSNPREATVESWGLVDGQPTGAHFYVRIYDDVVTRENVTTPEQIAKTTSAWELSNNLGVAEGGIERYIGTRYAIMDTYHEMMQRDVVTPRIYPSTDDGTATGKPVFLSPKAHEQKRKTQGPTMFSAQMLQKPISKATATFDIEHLKFSEIRPKTVNIYILGDPANSKRKGSDRTGMPVIAVDAQSNFYLVDGYNHKMNLTERWTALKGLRKKWMSQPGVQSVKVGYERYGMQADIEHFQNEMKRDGDAFDIMELAWPKDGPGAKGDRIGRLRPQHENGHFFLPLLVGHDTKGMCFLKVDGGEVKYEKATRETSLMRAMKNAGQLYRVLRPIRHKDEEGRLYDLTVRYIVEYLSHPAPGAFDDLIDAVSRMYDIEFIPPIIIKDGDTEPESFHDS